MKRALAALAATVALVAAMWILGPSNAGQESILVTTQTVEQTTVFNSIIAPGRLECATQQRVLADVPVRVTGVSVKLGQEVSAGDVLFTVEQVSIASQSVTQEEILAVLSDSGGDIEVLRDYLTSILASQIPYGPSDGFSGVILSPIDGTVTALPVLEGDTISPMGHCATISDLNSLQVRANVSEAHIAKIEEGMSATVTGEGFSPDAYDSTITTVMPVAKAVSTLNGTGETNIEVIAALDAPDNTLRPGYTVKLQIRTEVHENAVTVPYEAIVQDAENREWVFVVRDGLAQRQEVLTGLELQNKVEITRGIRAGDVIICDNVQNLLHGTPVRSTQTQQ